jgi:hypothetical protein
MGNLLLDLAIPDPGDGFAIDNTSLGTCRLVTAGVETRSIGAPAKIGPVVLLTAETLVGNCVVTVAGYYDENDSATLTFANTGEYALLVACTKSTGAFCWRLVAYEGVTGPSTTFDDLNLTTLTVVGLSGLGSITASSTLNVTGATTLTTAAITGALTGTSGYLATTLQVVGTSTQAAINASGGVACATTLDVDGITTLDVTEVDGTLKLADGDTVTQLTSTTTSVTINTASGQITTVASTLAAGGEETFTVSNSLVESVDTPIVCIASTSSAGTPFAFCSAVTSNSFDITVTNLHASNALDDTLVINYNLISGSSS